MTQVTLNRRSSRIGPLQIAIILFAVITAIIHLYMGTRMGVMPGPGAGHAGARPAGGPPSGGRQGGASLMGMLPLPLPILFDLNFVGYIVLVAALYLPFLSRFQSIIRWLLIAFTAVTVILWYILVGSHANMIGYADKFVEIVLIILLLIEVFQSRQRKA